MNPSVENPYRSTTIANDPKDLVFFWNGRRIGIEACHYPKTLFLIAGVTVTLDDTIRFKNSSLGFQESVPFQFEHEGRIAHGHLKTQGLGIIWRKFTLEIDSEIIARDRVYMRHWLKALFVSILIFPILGCAFLIWLISNLIG